jgi:hypothetical protein
MKLIISIYLVVNACWRWSYINKNIKFLIKIHDMKCVQTSSHFWTKAQHYKTTLHYLKCGFKPSKQVNG